jgi:hypothetical protein
MNDTSIIIWTGVFSLLSAIVGGVLVLIGQAYSQGRQDKAVRDQITFLLRLVRVQMAMMRDYPKYYRLSGFDTLLRVVEQRVLSTDGSVSLSDLRERRYLRGFP